MRHLAMRGPDGYGQFRVAWIVDCDLHPRIRRPLLRRQRAVAGVTCSHYNHHARSHQAIDFNAQGTLSTGKPLRVEIVSETDVNSVDQIQTTVAVLFLDVRHCRNQIADFAVTFIVEYLKTNEMTTRRHSANGIEHNLTSLYCRRIPVFVALNRPGDGTHFLRLTFRPIRQLFSGHNPRHMCAVSKAID